MAFSNLKSVFYTWDTEPELHAARRLVILALRQGPGDPAGINSVRQGLLTSADGTETRPVSPGPAGMHGDAPVHAAGPAFFPYKDHQRLVSPLPPGTVPPEPPFLLFGAASAEAGPPPFFSASRWRLALDYARRHRVQHLLLRALRHGRAAGQVILPPAPLLAGLEKEYRANIVRSLQMERELITLQQKFRAAGLGLMPLKGIALSRYLYGDPALRPCGDIDLLMEPAQLTAAAELLLASGYRRHELPQPLRERFNRRISHHQAFFCHCRGFYLELHRALSPRLRSSAEDLEDLWQRAQRVSLSGDLFPFLAAEDLLLHLAVHSATSSWQSLLQLHDLAVLLRRHPDLDWPDLLARAAEWRCRRRLLMSLAVTAAVWELRLPPMISREIAGETWIQTALASCLRRFGPAVQPQNRLGFRRTIIAARRQRSEPAGTGLLPDAADGEEAPGLIVQLVFLLRMMDDWRDRARILLHKTTNRLIKLVCRLDLRVRGIRLHRQGSQSTLNKKMGESFGTR